MVTLITHIILCGFATTFVIELLAVTLELFVSKATLYLTLSLPSSFGFLMVFLSLDKQLIVLVPATAFVATVLNKWLNKPVLTQSRLTRL